MTAFRISAFYHFVIMHRQTLSRVGDLLPAQASSVGIHGASSPNLSPIDHYRLSILFSQYRSYDDSQESIFILKVGSLFNEND